MLLYINGQLADLDAGQVIAQTKQVNDLNSLDNRQTNYTNKFKLPKTANNVRIMNFLSLTGNNSNVPYQKNECSLYSDNGECFVYNGWAVITDGGDAYEAVVYDGIIDLYKKIEGKSLADLTLTELNHEKNVDTVILSWATNINWKFKYIIADYNGKTMSTSNIGGTATPAINIDHMVPSVKVAWLWDKLFTENGFSYNGTIFNSEDFNNLWITYPKGVATIENEELLFESDDYSYQGKIENASRYVRKYFAVFNDTKEYSDTMRNIDKIHLQVPETGRYKLEVSGKLNTVKDRYDYANNLIETKDVPCNIIMGKNAQAKNPLTVTPSEIIAGNVASKSDFSKTIFINLNENDTICLDISATEEKNLEVFTISSGSMLNVKLTKVEPGVFDFNAAFADFPIRDFLNEVVHRYGLTMYKDAYSNSYTFLTLKELFQDSAIINWSDKFIKKASENYIYSNYAQQNWLRYNYNEKENSHNDGCITIQNTNLPESRDVIKSKIYSPEKSQVTLFNRKTNVYKLWDKEIVENPEPGEVAVTYKALDKRYYFLRQEIKTGLYYITSDLLQQSGIFNKIPVEAFTNLSFSDIAGSYYTPLQQILDKACIVTADLYLKDTDVINFDFKKRYYIEQLGANFIVNKINNYIPGKPVKCELIKVDNDIFEPFSIKINKIMVSSYTLQVYYETTDQITGVILEYDPGNEAWISLPYGGTNPITLNLEQGNYRIQLRANGKLSNNVTVTVPDIRTINIA